MKKILLATTLIAASAGFAAAEVAVSGTARMGVTTNTATGDAQFSSRFRVIFTASGETDGGLSFGASVRNDQIGTGGTANGDSTVYISGAFGKMTMGDTGNASDALLGQVSGVGYTSLGSMNELAFLAKDTTGALYEYSAGALTFAVGAGQANVTPVVVGTARAAGFDAMSVAAKYATDAYSIGLAYESSTGGTVAAPVDLSQVTLFGSATFSGATVKAKIVDGDASTDTRYAVSVDYAINGIGLTAYYADHQDAGTIIGGLNGAAYGVGASYDLGGGATVAGGVARNEGNDTVMDLGVKMSF